MMHDQSSWCRATAAGSKAEGKRTVASTTGGYNSCYETAVMKPLVRVAEAVCDGEQKKGSPATAGRARSKHLFN